MELSSILLPTTINTYVYHPLPEGCVRFLELFPDTTDAPLRCRILTCYLDDAPPYEALSYVWGPQEPLYDLQCSDVSPSVFLIGPNLHSALLHLRFNPTVNPHPRLLWVDRVCINQDDVTERASQVLLMRYIYRRCREGLVWLGQEDQNTKDAFECARYIHENALGRQTPWKSLSRFRSPPVSLVKLSDTLRSIVELTYKTWFERAWTFQEAILPSTVSLVCGNSSMPVEWLGSCVEPAVQNVHEIFSVSARLVFSTRKIKDTFLEDSGRLPPDDLERLLSFRREAKASDPRDIIFSLLGLFSPSVSLSLSPDYLISVKGLFTCVAKHIMLESQELRILCSVESPKHLKAEALPSWVPDWRAVPESYRNVLHDRNPRSGYQATRGSVYSYDPSPDAYELYVYGILIGSINQAGRFNHFHSISDFNLADRYIHTNQPITTALRQAQTLDFDVAYEVIPAEHEDRGSLAAFYDLPTGPNFRRTKCNQCPIAHAMPIISMEDAREDSLLHCITQNCSQDMESRAFFTTDSRYLGFGPACTAAGDQVFLLIGSDVPFVLRPAGEKFELVGACYVHGVMYGEGLHQDFDFNNQIYPGSTPGGEWDFSDHKVKPAIWMTVAANGDVLHDNGSIWDRLATARSNGAAQESRREIRRLLLCEEERDPVLIEAGKIILK
jgi:Heterokaryon incompatibility protein (HET)